jgi:16S rRNA (cytidine1402-2'-O)-methyltransferase
MPTLYVIATPIGNPDDLSPRAAAVLSKVGLVAAEDTRGAGLLLSRIGARPRLVSYTEHNKQRRIPEILARLAEIDVGLVSDAGTPAISDPGAELVAAARAAGYAVVPLPGPSAAIAALSVAGFRTRSFRYAGFLPREAGPLRRYLESLASVEEAVVAFESPRRLRRSLEAIATTLPERRVAVCRELTKQHEEVFVGTAQAALDYFPEPLGEIVIVIEGAAGAPAASDADERELREEIAAMRAAGLTRQQATALLSRRYGVSRRRLYELWLGEEA